MLRARIGLAAGVLLIAVGCYRGSRVLKLHYIPQFVPGTRAIFAPRRVAVAPAVISLAIPASRSVSELAVGTVSDENGDVMARLSVSDPAGLLSNALIRALNDSGLKAASLADRPEKEGSAVLKPPSGFDFLLSCDLVGISVNQRFGPQRTVHGQVFTMGSSVAMACTLHDRAGHAIFSATIIGDETEPPKPRGNEAFLPLESDPAESLSVALSRAISGLILMLKDRAALPLSS